MLPIHYRGRNCYSFKQLDTAAGAAKGTAFRAFKRLLPELAEGEDYLYLDAEVERETLANLRAQGAIYHSSHHVVLLTERGRQRLIAAL